MIKDEPFVNRLKSENEAFRKWVDLHSELDAKLHEMNRLKYLTSEENLEKKRLQKEKLYAKDRMHVILNRHKRLN